MLYAAEEPYSLILLDLLMPQMSGFQVLEACKKDDKLRQIPIIVMTSEKSAEVRSIRMGALDFITKPYRMPEVILARCERIVELSEEKSLIRSIEKDRETGLYTKDFFYAYIRRIPETRFDTDAIVLRFGGMVALRRCCGDEGVSDLLRSAAELVKSELLGTKAH
jgi:PleD family two-component response regulator